MMSTLKDHHEVAGCTSPEGEDVLRSIDAKIRDWERAIAQNGSRSTSPAHLTAHRGDHAHSDRDRGATMPVDPRCLPAQGDPDIMVMKLRARVAALEGQERSQVERSGMLKHTALDEHAVAKAAFRDLLNPTHAPPNPQLGHDCKSPPWSIVPQSFGADGSKELLCPYGSLPEEVGCVDRCHLESQSAESRLFAFAEGAVAAKRALEDLQVECHRHPARMDASIVLFSRAADRIWKKAVFSAWRQHSVERASDRLPDEAYRRALAISQREHNVWHARSVIYAWRFETLRRTVGLDTKRTTEADAVPHVASSYPDRPDIVVQSQQSTIALAPPENQDGLGMQRLLHFARSFCRTKKRAAAIRVLNYWRQACGSDETRQAECVQPSTLQRGDLRRALHMKQQWAVAEMAEEHAQARAAALLHRLVSAETAAARVEAQLQVVEAERDALRRRLGFSAVDLDIPPEGVVKQKQALSVPP